MRFFGALAATCTLLTHAVGQAEQPMYVLSTSTDRVETFDVTSGTYLGPFISSGLNNPRRLQYSTVGTMLISHDAGVDEFFPTTGALIREISNTGSYGAVVTPLNTLIYTRNSNIQMYEIEYGDLDFIRALSAPGSTPRSLDWLGEGVVRVANSQRYYDYSWPSWSQIGQVAYLPDWDMAVTPAFDSEGRVYWPDTGSDTVRRQAFDTVGAFEEFVVADGLNLLDAPTACVVIPSTDNLLVYSGSLHFFYEFDGETGAFIRRFGPFQFLGAVSEIGFLEDVAPPDCSLEADIDGDGTVSLNDLAILLANFGCN